LGRLLLVAKELAAKENVAGGYRLVNNCGAPAGQSVFHIHVHLLGGRAMGWPPG
jgi:histidine triad (HIT) family protein